VNVSRRKKPAWRSLCCVGAAFLTITLVLAQDKTAKTTEAEAAPTENDLKEQALLSIQHWEKARDATVSPAARDLVISRLSGRANFLESRGQSLNLSVESYHTSIEASTFEYLDSALRSALQERSAGEGKPVHPELRGFRVDEKAVESVDIANVMNFWESSDGFGWLTLTSTPSNAETYVDGEFKGYTTTTLGLSVGSHLYQVMPQSGAVCKRKIEIEKNHRYIQTCP
jgi:hypothetical protein